MSADTLTAPGSWREESKTVHHLKSRRRVELGRASRTSPSDLRNNQPVAGWRQDILVICRSANKAESGSVRQAAGRCRLQSWDMFCSKYRLAVKILQETRSQRANSRRLWAGARLYDLSPLRRLFTRELLKDVTLVFGKIIIASGFFWNEGHSWLWHRGSLVIKAWRSRKTANCHRLCHSVHWFAIRRCNQKWQQNSAVADVLLGVWSRKVLPTNTPPRGILGMEGQRRPARRYRPDEIEARVEREGRTPGGAATCCLLIDVCLCCQQITAHHRSSRHELDRAIRIPDTSSAPPSTTTRLLAEAPCRLFVVEPDSCRRLHSSCFDCNQRLSTPTRRRRRGTEWTTWIMEKAALHSTRVYWTLVTLFQYILFRRTFPSLKDT